MQLHEIDAIDFSPYGTLIDMTKPTTEGPKVNFDTGDGWRDAHTDLPVIDTIASLGMTIGDALPACVTDMERHAHTQEALFAAEEPIVFLLSSEGDNGPSADGVRAVVLRPGWIAVIDRGVWHSAARGLTRVTRYFYLAYCCENGPTEWRAVADGPIQVERPKAV